jgi:hypothetical protein
VIDLDAIRERRERAGQDPVRVARRQLIRHRCKACDQSLGRYQLLAFDVGALPVPRDWPVVSKRPRISIEVSGGRVCLRVECRCGRNEEIRLEDYSPPSI